jgi:hypothetical protein
MYAKQRGATLVKMCWFKFTADVVTTYLHSSPAAASDTRYTIPCTAVVRSMFLRRTHTRGGQFILGLYLFLPSHRRLFAMGARANSV